MIMKDYLMKRRTTRTVTNVNTPIPASLNQLLRKEIEALPEGFRNDYLKQEAFSKFLSDETDASCVRKERAILKWLAVEEDNEKAEERILTLPSDYLILADERRGRWDDFVSTVQKIVLDVIGDVPPDGALFGAFSGGATVTRRRIDGHPARKFAGQAEITSASYPLFCDAIQGTMWEEDLFLDHFDCLEAEGIIRRDLAAYGEVHESVISTALRIFAAPRIQLVDGNELFTVPKTSEIDRVACKEPSLNMYMQQGLGEFIKHRLNTRCKIDLSNQGRNRSLARTGSISGELATLDLSSASDSVTCALVETFLPPVWVAMLKTVRSPVTYIPSKGVSHVNRMISSMGNGFTFPLETLLFYSIARAVALRLGISGTISVYGDDIICPTLLAEPLAYALQVCGFKVNPKKSYWTGGFRESCGGHYYYGADVTPFYVKAPMRTVQDLIHVCNAVRKWSGRDGLGCLDPQLEGLWLTLSRHVPKRFWGGFDVDDKCRLVSYIGDGSIELSPMKVKRKLPEMGRYLLWHNTTHERNGSSAVNIGQDLQDTPIFEARRVPAFRIRKPDQLWPAEIAVM
jgi:hypothetical protein